MNFKSRIRNVLQMRFFEILQLGSFNSFHKYAVIKILEINNNISCSKLIVFPFIAIAATPLVSLSCYKRGHLFIVNLSKMDELDLYESLKHTTNECPLSCLEE